MFDDMFDTEEELLSGHKEGNVQSTWERQPRNCAYKLTLPDLPRKKGYPMGLKNQGATCYLNSLLQILYHTPEFRKLVLSLPLCIDTAEDPSNFVSKSRHNFLLGFQRLFSEMSLSDVRSVATDYLNKSFGWEGAQHMEQQDIQEAMRVIFDTIERALFETQYQQAIRSMFRGSTERYKSCMNCLKQSEHPEIFYDLQLQVKGNKSLQESLVTFQTPEVMDGDNKIFCENCQSKQDMFLGLRLRELPEILVFTLSRFDFDYQKMDRVKITQKFEFQVQVDLNSFLPNPNPAHHQYQLYGVLIHRGSAHGGHYLSYVRDLLHQSNWSQGLQDAQESEAKIREGKQKKEAETSDKSQKPTIKDPKNKDLSHGWYEINDNVATAIPGEKLASQFEGNESAYILFYRRKGLTVLPQTLKVPKYYDVPINIANTALEAQREIYDNQKKNIIINIKGEDHKLKTSLPIAEFLELFVPKGYALVQEAIHNGLPYYPMQFINFSEISYADKTLESEQVVHQSRWQTYQIGSSDYQIIRNVVGVDRLPFELVLIEGEAPKRIVCYNDENFLMLRLKIEKQLKIPYQKQILTLVTPYKQTILTDTLDNDNMPLPKLGIVHCGQIIIKTYGNEDEEEGEKAKAQSSTLCFLIERDDVTGLKRIYFEKAKTLSDLLKFVIASESLKQGKYRFRNLNGNRLYYLDHYEKRIQELQFTEQMIKLRIERGDIPIKGDISIKIKLQSLLLKVQVNTYLEKIFDPNTVLLDAKQWACTSVGLDPALHKLYLTDWTGEPIISLNREKITIFEANFSREELICLRDIHSPIGSELVHLQVFRTETGSPDSVNKESFHIKIEEFKSVGDLKDLIIGTVEGLNGLDQSCLRLRQIKRDYMFGTIWREVNKSVKSVTINSNKIVYQVLKEPESLKEDQIVLILKQRNHEKRVYENSVELILEAGRTPTIEALTEAVKARVETNQPIKIIKYFNYDFEWVEISKENIEKINKKKKSNQKGQKKEKNAQPPKSKKQNEKKEEESKNSENNTEKPVAQISQEAQPAKQSNVEKKNKNKNKKEGGEKKKPEQGQNVKPKEQKSKKGQENAPKTSEDCFNLRKAPILLKDGDWIGWGFAAQFQKDDLQTDQDLSLRVVKDKTVYKRNEKGGFHINVDF